MKIKVRDRDLVITEDETLVAGSVGEYEVEYELDDAWEGYACTAVFKTQAGLIKEVLVVNNRAVIPWEVLEEPQYITFGMYGVNDTNVRPTVWSKPKYVEEGTEQGDPVVQPETTPWAAALEQMAEDLDDAQDILDNIGSTVEEELQAAKESGMFDGFSPSASVTKSGKIATITITDKEGTTSVTVSDGDGGGSGTTDYNELNNKPQIAGTTLSGNKSLSDLGIAAESDIPDVSGFYTKPTSGIPAADLAAGVIPDVSGFYTKPAGGIPAADLATGVIPDVSGFYTKPAGGIPDSDLASEFVKPTDVDSAPAAGSTHPVQSGGVKTALDAKAGNTELAQTNGAIAIVQTGDNATQTIDAGAFVLWKGLLYTADASIPADTAFSTEGGNKNLTAVSNGGLNALNSITTESSTVSLRLGSETGTVVATGTATHRYCGRHHWVNIYFSDCSNVNVNATGYITGTNYLPSNVLFVTIGVRMSGTQYFVLFGQRMSSTAIVLRGGSIDNPGNPKWVFGSSYAGIYISYSWIA